jgi:hypothetical protein
LLDTIEPRWYAKIDLAALSGFEQVPYFLANFTSADQFNPFISQSVEVTVDKLGDIDTSAIESSLGDIALAITLGQLQSALEPTPYG